MKPQAPNTIIWDDIAQQYQDKFMDLPIYNDSYNRFCSQIPKENSQILEIGCGPGNVTKYIQNLRPDFIIDAIDFSSNMIQLAQLNNPKVNFKQMDCRTIKHLNKTYDAILIGFCLPYLSKSECEQLIVDASKLLRNEGVLYFSFIEGAYETSRYETSSDGKNSLFVYYHESNYLEEMLFANNFKLKEILSINYQKSELKTETHLIYIAELKSAIK